MYESSVRVIALLCFYAGLILTGECSRVRKAIRPYGISDPWETDEISGASPPTWLANSHPINVREVHYTEFYILTETDDDRAEHSLAPYIFQKIIRSDGICFQRHGDPSNEPQDTIDLQRVGKTENIATVPHIPPVIYPRLLITLDVGLANMSNDEVAKSYTKYIIDFWSAVDMMFQDAINPQVRLNIAGIVLANDRGAVPYLLRQDERFNGTNAMTASHEMVNHYVHKHAKTFLPSKYDILVTITNQELCLPSNETFNDCSVEIDGFADVHPFGGCAESIYGSTLLIRDFGSFQGVSAAVHYLNYTLGAAKNPFKKTFDDCNTEDKIDMEPTFHNETGNYTWTECSSQWMMRTCIERLHCMRNQPFIKKNNTEDSIRSWAMGRHWLMAQAGYVILLTIIVNVIF